MFNVQTLNKISPLAVQALGEGYTVADDVQAPDAILVRSASMHEMEMPESLLAIARAGAGVNNIPLDKCAEKGIVVFNTPGANANAVKELVLTGMLLSCRKVVDGIAWAKTLKGNGDAVGKMVEKGKSQFVGPEIKGKTLGVIGLGAIGILVANAAAALGMNVVGYDPYLSVERAISVAPEVKYVATLDEIYADSDFITIHVPLTPDTKGVINAESIAKMKDGVRILNFSRADLVVSTDILKGIADKKIACYVTDFATDDILGEDGVIALPHLGASTPESEDNCAKMAGAEIKDFLENGNIRNSVTLPNVSLARSGAARVCVIAKNASNVLADVCAKITENGNTVVASANQSKKDYTYMIFDTTAPVDADALKAVDGVIRVRSI